MHLKLCMNRLLEPEVVHASRALIRTFVRHGLEAADVVDAVRDDHRDESAFKRLGALVADRIFEEAKAGPWFVIRQQMGRGLKAVRR